MISKAQLTIQATVLPHSIWRRYFVEIIYYKRKLATYNFTVFDLRTKEGICYMWDESVARRSSCDIASCLWLWLENLPTTVKRVTFYSDLCSGQNRNINVTGMMLAAVNCLPLEHIDHTFLESGHTQMEVDSMHAVIERSSHSAEIFVPRDWVTIASVAKTTGKPYRIHTMQGNDFIDFKSVSSAVIENKNGLESGKRLNWMQCKWFQFRKGSSTVGIKTERDDSEFELLCVSNSDTIQSVDQFREVMKPMYAGPVPIAPAKYKDLQYLCKTKVIPLQFHHFYKNLEYSSRVADKLQEPDAEEESDTDDETETNVPSFNDTDTVLSHQAIGFEQVSASRIENGTRANDNRDSSDPSSIIIGKIGDLHRKNPCSKNRTLVVSCLVSPRRACRL
jgi:hypothetical protein